MTISVILPTRKRPLLTARAIRTLLNNSSKEINIEILLRFDDDDTDSLAIVKESIKIELGEDANKKIKYLVGPRYGWPQIYRYFNECVVEAREDCEWLMIFNDDALMLTKNWDKNIEKYNGKLVIWPSWFPIIPKKVFDIWGHFSLTRQCDTEIIEIVGKLRDDLGYDIKFDPAIGIQHGRENACVSKEDITHKERDYQSDYYNLKYELSRRRDAALLKDYIETGEIKRNKTLDDTISGYGDIGTGDVDDIGVIGEKDGIKDIDKIVEEFEKKKSESGLYHHDDQINLQKKEYELLARVKPDILKLPLFKLVCHIIPFHNSVPHIFTYMNLARYSKVGILEIGTGHGEGIIALGIGAKMYGLHNPRLTTVDRIQPENEAIGFFELFKEYLPFNGHCQGHSQGHDIVAGNVLDFDFNKSIDLLCINRNIIPEDLYAICSKYIPLVIKGGVVTFLDTGCRELTNAILKYLNDSNTSYRVLSPNLIDNDSRFLYNDVGIGVIRIL